ncbi:MAG: prolipoprotein diacylglyceryl transferase [Verrucomicrobiota bacterium]|nr:prolipoprotein diacylglyceryl transferase [Verrucomicrobiota bacterium]
MLAFYWDPKPEMFVLPVLQWPILWYGVLFACGFALGFPIFIGALTRFFLQRPDIEEREIIGPIQDPRIASIAEKGKENIAKALNEWLVSNEPMDETLPKKESFYASCSLHAQAALRRLKLEHRFPDGLLSLKRQAIFLTDRIVVYMVVATVVGARLGHFFFYESPGNYLTRPWVIFQFPFNGLASHGAAIAIVIALYLFAWRYRSQARGLTGLRLLDFVSIPAALAGAFIRVGNFFNQEILGKMTDVPWAVTFGHPADHSPPFPRHPVQLYETLAYALVFFLLWKLSFRPKYLLEKGKLLGLFLILVFGARFLIEFWKVEQSHILSSALTMGQFLSIPAVLIGAILFFRERNNHLSVL